jgi:Alginate lyase
MRKPWAHGALKAPATAWAFFVALLLSNCFIAIPQAQSFVHPGGLHKLSDLERMRHLVTAKAEPWNLSFLALSNHPGAKFDYAVRGDSSLTQVNRDPCVNCAAFESDATAAYLQALMWSITGNTRHADKAVQIFNAWKNLTSFRGGGTEALNAGVFVWKLVEAAEIIQSTYAGWRETDKQKFKAMLVYPGYSNTAVPASLNDSNGTFYWRIYNGDPGRHGNQDLIAWRAMITMGVFLDNRIMYDRALRYFKGLPHRSDDLPYASGPSVAAEQLEDNAYFTTYRNVRRDSQPDYGYNGVLQHYIWENGQNQESSRDQQHAFFGMGTCAGIAEVAWNQGDTVWNAHDNRLLSGFEFMARYNTSYVRPFPDQGSPWEPIQYLQRFDRTGRWFLKSVNPFFENDFVRVSRGDFAGKRPVYEQATAHFVVRMGFGERAKWTLRSRDVAFEVSGPESNGFSLDHPGWGSLTFRRPMQCAGDPVRGFAYDMPIYGMPVLPVAVEAEDFDHFPGTGQTRTYFDRTPANDPARYRPQVGADIAVVENASNEFVVTDFGGDEWMAYTFAVSKIGEYAITLRLQAPSPDAAVQVTIDGMNSFGPIRFESPRLVLAAKPEWQYLVMDTLPLALGVYNLRVSSMGAPITLDQIFLTPPGSEQVNTLRRGKKALRPSNREHRTPTRQPARLLHEGYDALGKRPKARP